VCVLPLPSAHEAAGAKGIRRSPRPLRGVNIYQRLGRIASRDLYGCLEIVIATRWLTMMVWLFEN
jgi:hypothetical protein